MQSDVLWQTPAHSNARGAFCLIMPFGCARWHPVTYGGMRRHTMSCNDTHWHTLAHIYGWASVHFGHCMVTSHVTGNTNMAAGAPGDGARMTCHVAALTTHRTPPGLPFWAHKGELT